MSSTRRFYRIVRTNPPTLDDFTSNVTRGRPLPRGTDAETARLWSGLSVYATEAQARRLARSSPMLGRYLVEIDVSQTSDIRIERTTSGRGHYTVWGTPAELLGCVVRIATVPSKTESKR